jgi:hypothetical protein
VVDDDQMRHEPIHCCLDDRLAQGEDVAGSTGVIFGIALEETPLAGTGAF